MCAQYSRRRLFPSIRSCPDAACDAYALQAAQGNGLYSPCRLFPSSACHHVSREREKRARKKAHTRRESVWGQDERRHLSPPPRLRWGCALQRCCRPLRVRWSVKACERRFRDGRCLWRGSGICFRPSCCLCRLCRSSAVERHVV